MNFVRVVWGSSVPGGGQICVDDSASSCIYIRCRGLKSDRYWLLTHSENAEVVGVSVLRIINVEKAR